MTAAELARIGGFVFPDDMSDFRSVALEDDLQYDIMFTTQGSAVDEFVTGSGLPPLSSDTRLLIHASPLWDLNPPEGSTISSTSDDHRGVTRTVEVVTPDGASEDGARATVHISLTPTR